MGWTPVKGTPTVSRKCPKCHNTTEHSICTYEGEGGVGAPAMGGFNITGILSHIASAFHGGYVLICPICRNETEELNEEQVNALKRRG